MDINKLEEFMAEREGSYSLRTKAHVAVLRRVGHCALVWRIADLMIFTWRLSLLSSDISRRQRPTKEV
jgi:hypothetical protein